MASTTKKDSKKSNAKPRRTVVKKSQPKQAQNIQSLRRERDESLEREAATSEIMRMIARSPTELQPVLDAIAERAARLCDADDAVVWRVDGEVRRRVAHFGQIPTGSALAAVPDRGGVIGRAIMDCQTIHVHDLQAAEAEFPRTLEWHGVFAECSRRHYFTGAWPSALLQFADERFVRSRIGKSNCLKPSL